MVSETALSEYQKEQKKIKEEAEENLRKKIEESEEKQKQRDKDLVEFLRVSVNDGYDGNPEDGYYIPLNERQYEGFVDKSSTYFSKFSTLVFKYGLMVLFMSFNFIALSVSLNCNEEQALGTRIISALFAFFFGIVYLIVNYYTYRVLHKGEICKMNSEKLFPFKI